MKRAGRYRDHPKASTRHGAEFCLPARISVQLDTGIGKASFVLRRLSGFSAISSPCKTKKAASSVAGHPLGIDPDPPRINPHSTRHHSHPAIRSGSRYELEPQMNFIDDHRFGELFEKTLAKARKTGKNVLVEFGGDWCVWSRRMEKVLASESIERLLRRDFHYVRCFLGDDGECPFPEEIELPEFDSVPYFVLMDGEGQLVASSATEDFELLWFYRKKKLLLLLREWAQMTSRH